ncbi:MAG: glycine zipper 2TM domain-containing protein [Erythrobacter sp.]
MKTFSFLAIAAPAMALALPAVPAAAAELPLAVRDTLGVPAASLPITEIAEHRKGKHGRIYDHRGRYIEPRRLGRNDRVWRDDRGRWRCRRDNGTTGLIIGAGAGALLGRAIDTEGDRALGTVLGAVGGGLLGREIDRGDIRCR